MPTQTPGYRDGISQLIHHPAANLQAPLVLCHGLILGFVKHLMAEASDWKPAQAGYEKRVFCRVHPAKAGC
jgi:hypothetical protein